MTNEELLQQAKDQVAAGEGSTWDSLCYYRSGLGGYGWQEHQKDHDAAAILAIQSAREEAQKDFFIRGYHAGHARGYDDHYNPEEAYQKELKKLTAPGR